MYHPMARLFVKWTQVLLVSLASAWLVYRGQTYTESTGSGMVGPTMCVLAALFLLVSSVSLIFRSPERANAG